MPPKPRPVGAQSGARPAHPPPTSSRTAPIVPPTPQVALANLENKKRSRHAFLQRTSGTPAVPATAPAAAPATVPAELVAPVAPAVPIAHSAAGPSAPRGVSCIYISLIVLALTLSQTMKNVIMFGHDGPPPVIPAPPTPPPRRSRVAFLENARSDAPHPPATEEVTKQSVCIPSVFHNLILIQQIL